MTNHSSPVTVDTLAAELQSVIDSFEAQRVKYGNLASDPKVNDVNQEIWASLANEKTDDLRVLRKLLSIHGHAQRRLTAEDVYAACEGTLIGFRDELTERNIKFICDQVSRKVILALTSTVRDETVKPHIYMPDYQAMGDCRVCGYEQDKPWHTLTRPECCEHGIKIGNTCVGCLGAAVTSHESKVP